MHFAFEILYYFLIEKWSNISCECSRSSNEILEQLEVSLWLNFDSEHYFAFDYQVLVWVTVSKSPTSSVVDIVISFCFEVLSIIIINYLSVFTKIVRPMCQYEIKSFVTLVFLIAPRCSRAIIMTSVTEWKSFAFVWIL